MILGINYSKRNNGNCSEVLRSVLNQLEKLGEPTKYVSIDDYDIRRCCDYNYLCFRTGKCATTDDFSRLLNEIKEADSVIASLPVYRGHLISEYFLVSERLEGAFRLNDATLLSEYLGKMNYILICNKNAGLNNGLRELMYEFEDCDYEPKILIGSAREYGLSSIEGNIMTSGKFMNEVRDFVEKVSAK